LKVTRKICLQSLLCHGSPEYGSFKNVRLLGMIPSWPWTKPLSYSTAFRVCTHCMLIDTNGSPNQTTVEIGQISEIRTWYHSPGRVHRILDNHVVPEDLSNSDSGCITNFARRQNIVPKSAALAPSLQQSRMIWFTAFSVWHLMGSEDFPSR
jgi:hypothetical protein